MKELEKLLIESGAILEGHFLLTSGRHSNKYVEKFRLLENPFALESVCKLMSEKYKNEGVELVLGAAIGGILLCGGVGKELNAKHIFTEREDKKIYYYNKYIYFFLGFVTLALAEIIVRYSGVSWNHTLIYYLIPTGMIPIFYFILTKAFKYENLS